MREEYISYFSLGKDKRVGISFKTDYVFFFISFLFLFFLSPSTIKQGSSHNMGQPPPSTTPAITTTATASPPGTTTPPMYYGTNSQGGGGGGYPAHHHHHHHHQQPYGTHGPLLGQPRSHTGFSMPPRGQNILL